MVNRILVIGALAVTVLAFAACSEGPSGYEGSSEDVSASGIAAEIVGSALSQSSSDGTITMSQTRKHKTFFASSPSCPTLTSSNSSGANTCSSSSNVATLDYSDCSFGSSTGSSTASLTATWNGYDQLSFSGSTSLACGAFPSPTSDTLLRQAVASVGGAASKLTRTSSYGSTLTVDDTTSGIDANYQDDTFNGSGPSGFTFTPFNSGGGKEVVFNGSGQRTSVTVAEHLSAIYSSYTIFDHTIAGTVNVSESGSGSSTSWVANVGTVSNGVCSGGVITYDNLTNMMTQTCFENVTYNTTCCAPVSGTIVSSFSMTSNSPTDSITTAMSGQNESMTITGCGTANYITYAGTTLAVNLDQCF